MNKTTVAFLHNFIPEEAHLATAQAWQKECLSVPVIAEFAALFCTGPKTHQYSAGAVESLSVHWKGSLMHWNPASVRWKASPVQWKDQLRALESWPSQQWKVGLHNNTLQQHSDKRGLCFSAIRF